MQSGIKQEAKLNKQQDLPLFIKSYKEATDVTGAHHHHPPP